ncbi:hypothetical protein BKA56DRAFT_616481 [Ilyonectria sp. MPI-CAGE-AT-0026]|nr:hypothetical protein BKA56DRAFT_616481 [Ilyonectria sp. MPI-CAGE-AT-0026]
MASISASATHPLWLAKIIDVQTPYPTSEYSHEVRAQRPEGERINADRLIDPSSAHIKTHRYQALMDNPGISDKFEAFPLLDVADRPPRVRTSLRPYVSVENQIFPSTSLDSLQVCLDSFVVTPYACSTLLAGYAAMMILYFHNPAVRQISPHLTSDQLEEQCRLGVAAIARFLSRPSAGFPFLGTLTGNTRTWQRLGCFAFANGNFSTAQFRRVAAACALN